MIEEPKKYQTKSTQQIANMAIVNFQKYIRMRDSYNGGNCISCGKHIDWNNDCDAGHYISRRFKETLFDESNCHAQCKHCNQWLNGNIIEYRKNLINKIGEDSVNELEENYTSLMQRKRVDFIALNELYLKKCRGIRNE